jgi:integrase
MAYAEKRGKGPAPWRVKYRLPSGIEVSESGFETRPPHSPGDGTRRPGSAKAGGPTRTPPPLIPYNPALRPRNRGRRTGRRLQLSPQRAWATPLETLLLAERAALLTGRDEDFTMILTIGYTGLRWGEAIGLECGYLHPGGLHVEWQLRELNGRFYRLPPKDDSYRSPAWEPCLPVDLPPFLTGLLSRQIRDHPRPTCSCAPQHGGSGRYLFLGPDGGHYRRSNYARRVFRPACDGRYEAKDADPLSSSSPTRPPGLAIQSLPGHRRPCPLTMRRRAAAASRSSAMTHPSPAGFPSSRA